MTELLPALPFAAAVAAYWTAARFTRRKFAPWPLRRSLLWGAGIAVMAAAFVDPLADRARHDFAAHMVVHSFVGMAGPLLLALAAPVTLVLRAVGTNTARRLARLLKSKPLAFVGHPLTAAVLHIGGLWPLYTTNLYAVMHQNAAVYAFVHLHLFLAGYLFSAAMIGSDPSPHRTGFLFRAGVLIAALGLHDTLAKIIYAHPPAGVPPEQAKAGALLMYYAGDLIELPLIVIFCMQWLTAVRARRRRETVTELPPLRSGAVR